MNYKLRSTCIAVACGILVSTLMVVPFELTAGLDGRPITNPLVLLAVWFVSAEALIVVCRMSRRAESIRLEFEWALGHAREDSWPEMAQNCLWRLAKLNGLDYYFPVARQWE